MTYQPDLHLVGRLEREFLNWLETPAGRQASERFVRIALGLRSRGMKAGAKAIWERLRWNFMLRRDESGGQAYLCNNNFTAYMARLAMEKEPVLRGYFETREIRATETEQKGTEHV